MRRLAILAYGVFCYLVSQGVILYTIGFVGGLLVPKSVDSGPEEGWREALLLDLMLLGLFAVPHSVMARQGFKRMWTRVVPPPVERSTYVLVSSLLLALLCWQWRPLPDVVWDVAQPAGRVVLLGLFGAGWGIALWATFLTDHFALFGLRQVYREATGQACKPVGFKTAALYRLVRHPLMLGFLIGFWATPRMTAGHLLFAAAMTAYILVAVRLEERDLMALYGDAYRDYQRRVGMLLPLVGLRPRGGKDEASGERTAAPR
jgi:protein-S-isoprenylcysteine O-methyltransferase Ste14